MSEDVKKTRRRLLTASMIVILVLVFAYMVYMILKVKTVTWAYRIVIGIAFLLVWLIGQVISPIVLDEFSDRTKEQKTAYYVYAGLSLIGYAGLVFYALSLNSETGIYGVIVFAVTMFTKRKFYDDFKGITHDEDEEEADDEAPAEEIADAETDAEAEKMS